MKRYHFLYKTTNQINGKYYYGIHSTDNLNDHYLGSGKGLWRAIHKYGKENFKREIVEMFDTREDAAKAERRMVSINLCKDPNCYNCKEGGEKESLKEGCLSDETKQLLSRVWKDTHPPLSKEVRQKMSESHRGERNYLYKGHHTQEWIDNLKARCATRIKMYYLDKPSYKWVQEADKEAMLAKGMLLECKPEYAKVYMHKGSDIIRVPLVDLAEWQAKGYVRGQIRDRSYMGSVRYRDYVNSEIKVI